MSNFQRAKHSKTSRPDEDRDISLIEALSHIGTVGSAIALPTVDQSERFLNIDGYFYDLRRELQAYFGGHKSPFHGKGIYEQIVCTDARYFRALYDLIFDGWEAIESASAAESSGLEIPGSPGAALVFILQSYQDGMARPAIEGGSVNIEQSRRVLALLDENSKSAPSAKTRHYASELVNRGKELGTFIAFCVDSVKARLRGKPHLKRDVAQFESARRDRTRILNKAIRGLKGESWNAGKQKLH